MGGRVILAIREVYNVHWATDHNCKIDFLFFVK